MTAPLVRAAHNPLLSPAHARFMPASGVFNPGVGVDHRSGQVVILFRAFDKTSRRSSLGLALSSDGVRIQEVWERPALVPEAPYEEWGVEDPRITFLAEEERYAITYVGYAPPGPRACLITTDDLLSPGRYVRHGPCRLDENKDHVVFPEKVRGQYVVVHRPPPRMVLTTIGALEAPWPDGVAIVGPRAGTWRSARVGAGPPPLKTPLGWLLAFHGATTLAEGNVYSMGWCLLDLHDPARVLYVSHEPVLVPEAPYEIVPGPVPQVDMANFPRGVRVVFPQGLVERNGELLVYYGAGDVHVALARVRRDVLLSSLEIALRRGEGAPPL